MVEQPILLDVPDELATARLHMRCPRAGDGEVVHASVLESVAALRRFPASLPWAIAEPTVDASETYCREAHARFVRREALSYLVFLRQSREHVGNVAIHDVDWSVPKGELGYWCRSRLAGQGLMSEAVLALTELGMSLGLRRIQALTDDENAASCRLLERVGYSLEGVLRHERSAPAGEPRNTRVYARIR